MSDANTPYDSIADWYDAFVDGPIHQEIVLPNLVTLIGDVRGLQVLDLACGQGVIARELARRGAIVTGVDISTRLLAIARRYEDAEPLGIHYLEDDAQSLNRLPDSGFHGVTCNLALMDIPDFAATLVATASVLCPGGWLVLAITHPCFEVPRGEWTTRDDGTQVREVTGYFDEGFWLSDNREGVRGKVGARHRMLGTYLNALADAGFRLKRVIEPRAYGARALEVPGNREVPSIMLLRAIADS
jgi:SAM-dependent methyltransferase